MCFLLTALLAASPVTVTTSVEASSHAFDVSGVVAQPVSTLSLVARSVGQLVKQGFEAMPAWLRVPAGVVALFGMQWAGQGWLEQAADPYRAARDFWVRGSVPAQGPSLALATF